MACTNEHLENAQTTDALTIAERDVLDVVLYGESPSAAARSCRDLASVLRKIGHLYRSDWLRDVARKLDVLDAARKEINNVRQ